MPPSDDAERQRVRDAVAKLRQDVEDAGICPRCGMPHDIFEDDSGKPTRTEED
jgi:hypothetical protein